MGKGATDKAGSALATQNVMAKALADLAGQQQKIGTDIYKQTEPARTFGMNTYMGLAKGNQPGIQRYTAPQINAATQQYSMARKAIEQMAPGGARDAALRNLHIQEAGTKNQIYSGGVADALSKATGLGYGGVGMGTGALMGAGEMYSGAGKQYLSQAAMYNDMASQMGALAGHGAQGLGAIAAMV